MITRLPVEQVRYLRLRSQRLVGAERRAPSGVARLLEELCGVQAQEAPAASLALRVRGRGLTAADVERARVEERSIARTWCMRGTLHLLASADLGWLLPLLGPLSIRRSGRRYAQLDLDEGKSVRAVGIIGELLLGRGPMTRAELAGRLAERGIRVEGQAVYHLIRRAGLEGVLCYGPDRDGEPTFVIFEKAQEHRALSRDATLAELARRYLAAYGPAGPGDMASWSGLPMGQARAGFERVGPELLEVEIDGEPAWMLESRAAWLEDAPESRDSVRLLPAYDPYLLGYARRDLGVPETDARRIHPGGGLFRPVLLLDGKAAGIWKSRRKKDGLAITVEPFQTLATGAVEAIEEEVRDVGRFLGTEATWIRRSERIYRLKS